jgi:pimeloyl-ACP methyl ester carboxylesterase
VVQEVVNEISWASLSTLTLPLLVIAGGADLFVPAPVLREVVVQVRSAEMVVVPDAGHSVHWERPDEFNRAALEFIQRVDSQPV